MGIRERLRRRRRAFGLVARCGLTLLQGLPLPSRLAVEFLGWFSFASYGRHVGLKVGARRQKNRLHIYKRPCCTPAGADPDTNRSAGLHSIAVLGRRGPHAGLVEFTGCRSDLSMHLRKHVYRGRLKRCCRWLIGRLSGLRPRKPQAVAPLLPCVPSPSSWPVASRSRAGHRTPPLVS